MRAWIRTWIICAGVVWIGIAQAAPPVDARDSYKRAAQLDDDGDAEQALVVIEQGLATAPRNLLLLGLKGAVLLKLRDYAGALAAYQAYLAAGPTGANRREAQKIVDSLGAVQSTFLDIELANGPAAIYLDSKTQGLLCTAQPSCHQAMLPGTYRVIAERAGFERWTGPVTVASGVTARLAVTLVEKPSLLTVRAEPPGATVTVDGTSYSAPMTVAAGSHRVVVSLAGHVEAVREVAAHEGQPMALDVALDVEQPSPLAVHVEPAGAELLLDDTPVALGRDGLAVPPGGHVLVVRAPGYRDRRVEIPAERPADYQVVVVLAPVEAVVVAPPPGPPPRDAGLSAATAFALSAGGTLVSWSLVVAGTDRGSDPVAATGWVATMFAPSFGHWYARSFLTRGFVYRLAGLGTAFLGGSVIGTRESDAGKVLVLAGAGLYIGGSIADLATVRGQARAYNAKLLGVAVVPVVRGDGGSLVVAGQF